VTGWGLSLAALCAAAPADWPQGRRDAQNSAAAVLDAPGSGRPRPWVFEGSGRVWGYEPGMTVWSSPALGVVGGRAVVAVGSYDRNVYELDAASGELLWKVTTGAGVYAAPALFQGAERTLLFAASSDRLVYALDAATGARAWIHTIEEYRPSMGGARLEAPCVGEVRGRAAVFASFWIWDRSLGHNLQRAGAVALEAQSGERLWRADLGDNAMTAPLFAKPGGRPVVYLGSSDGSLTALDAGDGKVLWRKAELDAIRGAPALAELPEGPRLITASKFGAVRALDALTGEERWRFKTGERVTGSPAVAAVGGRLRVFVGSYDRRLYALDAATGALAWSYEAKAGFYSSPALADVPGGPAVLASAWDHGMHAVRAGSGERISTTFTGRPLWDVAGLDDSNWSSPVAARVNGEWMAYLGSYDGVLRAIPLEPTRAASAALRSNGLFWLSFPIALAPVAALALGLTRRTRERSTRGEAG
jgi:hypothetical protein